LNPRPALLEVVLGGGEPAATPLVGSFTPGFLCAARPEDPFGAWWESDGCARSLAAAARRLGCDGLVVEVGGREPGRREEAEEVLLADGLCRVTWRNGSRSEVGPTGGERTFDRPPSLAEIDPARLGYWEEGRLHPPGPVASWRTATVAALAGPAGWEGAIHARVNSPFTQLMGCLGYEGGLLALVGEPARAGEMLGRFTAAAVEVGRGLVGAGARALLLASPESGAAHISRRLYREWVLPWEKECIARLAAATGIPVYTWLPGPAADRLDLLLATGTAGLAGAAAPPAGDLDLARDRAFLAERGAFLMGGIDPERHLLRRSPVALGRTLAELAALPRRGFILAPCRPIPAGVPAENLALTAQSRRGN